MVNSKKICTVVVTYNRLDLLKKAIKALRDQSYPSDILIINNGSNDGTTEYLKEEPGITVINQDNCGGAGGFFTGMKYAVENGYEFTWIMDDDVAPFQDALENLVVAYEELSQKEKLGFLCSTVLDTEGNPANLPFPDLKIQSNGFADWNRFAEKGIIKVCNATFVSLFIPTENIIELGLPYREFFIWGDDTEYTGRICSKYPAYLISKSKVEHYRVGGQIDLVTMREPGRIKMMKYAIRNEWFCKKGGVKKSINNFRRNIKLINRLIKTRQFKKINIVLQGIKEGIFFNPKIIYPQKQGING